MENSIFQEITKKHSTTFYYATLLFPKTIRTDVFTLYAFLRTADDLVDEKKDRNAFTAFKNQTYRTLKNKKTSNDSIINAFVRLFYQYDFQKNHLDSFFESLDSDFTKPLRLKSKQELDRYMYGVAGVVGLMMARIMGLPESSYRAAQKFGEVMQLVNIIRDIKEDYANDRVYIPQDAMKKYGLKRIVDYQDNQSKFVGLIQSIITDIQKNMDTLSGDIQAIPQPYRRSITISRDIYRLICQEIYQDPMVVWRRRVYLSNAKAEFPITFDCVTFKRGGG